MKKLGKYNLLISAALMMLQLQVTGQNRFELTAKEAVDLAFKNVFILKNAHLDYRIQEAQNKEITGQAYPQANGTVSASRFFSIPVTAIPDFISPSVYNVLEQNNVENGTTGSPIKSPGNFGIFPAQFGVPWTASAGFTIQQLLFQPDVFIGLQARKTALEFAKNNIAVIEDTVKASVYNAYYSVLIARKQLVFTNEGIARLEKLLRDQNVMYTNGFLEKVELDRTSVNLTNLRTTNNRLQNINILGAAALKLTLGISQKDSLILKDTLTTAAISEGVLDNSGFRYEDRSEIRLLNTAESLQKLNVKRQEFSYLPTVAAFWNYSRNAQRLKFNFFDTNQKWFPTSIVGLNINVPIFDGFQKRYRIQQARLNLEKTTNSISSIKNFIDFQQEGARSQLTNAIASLKLQEDNVQVAERVLNVSRRKFEEGVGSNFELLQSETDLQTAQSNYFQALYDATVARTGYLRAIGKL
jgi:outer membrane protein TolC